MSSRSLGQRLRVLEVRIASRMLGFLWRRPGGPPLLRWMRKSWFGRKLQFLVLGSRSRFEDFATARRCAISYNPHGHNHPKELEFHLSRAGALLESDYPALYYMSEKANLYRRIFDFGGNIGNLFYSYQPKLNFSSDLEWMVYDLPEKREGCSLLAEHHKELRVSFTTDLGQAAGVDLFVASGSMHYFERRLDRILADLPVPPRQVLVNRTPFSRGEDIITVQDTGSYFVPCVAYGRPAFVAGMHGLGYALRAEWPTHERRLRVPLYSDVIEPTYGGIFFELNTQRDADLSALERAVPEIA